MKTALLVGLGAAGQRHARNLRRLLNNDVRLIACRATRAAPLLDDRLTADHPASLERAYGIESYDHLEEALEQRPSLAFVCNPTSLHLTTALAAANAGCHLFIEKPLSHALDGVAELLSVVRQRDLVTMVGFQLRFHPCLLRLRELLERRAIGSLLAVDVRFAEYLPSWHPYEDYRQSYAARRDLGGGVLLTQIHDLDYVQWLFGAPSRLFAVGGRFGRLEIDVEDSVDMLLACEIDGRSLPVHIHQNYVERNRVRRCRITGEDGVIVVDLMAPSLSHYSDSGKEAERYIPPGFERNQLFLDELRHFLSCVDAGRPTCVPIQEGLVSLQLAAAGRESMESGRSVELRQAAERCEY